MKISFLGIGQVGSALACRLVEVGHRVSIAARNPESESVKAALAKTPALTVGAMPEAVAEADVVFLATPFENNDDALQNAGDLTGKVVVDCTNPVAPDLTHSLENEISGGEFVQNLIPTAKVVKAFTIYGFENFENSSYPGYGELRPAMLIAGNDGEAKQTVGTLCHELGWEPVDTGDIATSLHLEHLTLLWIKMARVQGYGADLVWGRLKR
ncbi:MAG: NADPH-dependent F420 reductase [bacterium]